MRIVKTETKEAKNYVTYQVTIEFSVHEGSKVFKGDYKHLDAIAKLKEKAGELVIDALSVLAI